MAPYVIDKVKTLILTGPTAKYIEQAVISDTAYNGSPKIIHALNLDEAVQIANDEAVTGDIITLSPACASFDAFPNFAARGKYFKELVNKL